MCNRNLSKSCGWFHLESTEKNSRGKTENEKFPHFEEEHQNTLVLKCSKIDLWNKIYAENE
jgi:hypothetical protein